MSDAIRNAIRNAECSWSDDGDEEGNYETACGRLFSLTEGTPEENGMRFCCYCGGLLKAGERKQAARNSLALSSTS